MIIFYQGDGSQTIMHVANRKWTDVQRRELEYGACRIIELRDDGSIVVHKDRTGAKLGEILPPLVVVPT